MFGIFHILDDIFFFYKIRQSIHIFQVKDGDVQFKFHIADHGHQMFVVFKEHIGVSGCSNNLYFGFILFFISFGDYEIQIVKKFLQAIQISLIIIFDHGDFSQ